MANDPAVAGKLLVQSWEREDSWQRNLGKYTIDFHDFYADSNTIISSIKQAQDDDKRPPRCKETCCAIQGEGYLGDPHPYSRVICTLWCSSGLVQVQLRVAFA